MSAQVIYIVQAESTDSFLFIPMASLPEADKLVVKMVKSGINAWVQPSKLYASDEEAAKDFKIVPAEQATA